MKALSSPRLFLASLACLCLWALTVSAADAPRVLERRPAQQAIHLQPLLAPRSGSAAFYITEVTVQEVAEASGIFALADPFGEDLYTVHSVRVHYTVLSSEADTARLHVRAQPVDPWTGMPLAPVRWEAAYLITPDGPTLESGDEIPASYEDLVAPYWLADWSATEREELPTAPLLPGAQWSSPANFEWDDLGVGGLAAPVTGTFVGWVDAGDLGSAAYVSEGVETSASEIQEFYGGIYGNRAVAVQIVSDHWLLAGDFPYGTEKRFTMHSVMTVGPSTGAPPGIEGEVHLFIEMSQFIDRDLSEEPWLAYTEQDAIEAGSSVSGLLGPWSETLEDGTYTKAYAFYGTAGDAVEIHLSSHDFDAFLYLTDEAFDILASDDDSGGGDDALITVVLPHTGVYYIFVNTYFEGEEGLYTLSAELVEAGGV